MSGGILIVGDQGHPRALERAAQLGGDIVENPAAIERPIDFLSRIRSGVVTDVIMGPGASVATETNMETVCHDLRITLHRVG